MPFWRGHVSGIVPVSLRLSIKDTCMTSFTKSKQLLAAIALAAEISRAERRPVSIEV